MLSDDLFFTEDEAFDYVMNEFHQHIKYLKHTLEQLCGQFTGRSVRHSVQGYTQKLMFFDSRLSAFLSLQERLHLAIEHDTGFEGFMRDVDRWYQETVQHLLHNTPNTNTGDPLSDVINLWDHQACYEFLFKNNYKHNFTWVSDLIHAVRDRIYAPQ